MGLFTTLPEDLTEVDVIIAGGGTAGCIVAARLAEADPQLSILVIEGGSNNDAPEISIPILLMANLMPGSKTNIFYQSKPEEQLGGRELIVPSGGVLGGGSSTNMMMYSRAQKSDFDEWDVPGWSAEEMMPFLKKIETFHGPDPTGAHGNDGPIQVSKGTFTSSRLQDQFISSAEKLGWPEITDLQALDEKTNGVQRALRYISPDGKRQDTASRYLHPKLQDDEHFPNLQVLVQHQVVKVLFDNNKKAVGVEFTPNPLFQEETTQPPSTQTIKARTLVILSCGAIGTPTLLERSGIGNSHLLNSLNISVVSDLPGVGKEYEDHQLNVYPYFSSLDPEETADALYSGRRDLAALIQNNDKILGWNAQEVTCKLRPSEEDIVSLGPDFEEIWNKDFEPIPDRPLGMMAPVAAFPADPSTVPIPNKQYFAISTFSVYPYSRGHVHITSSSPSSSLDFQTGFFSDTKKFDIKTHKWLYKTQREIARQMSIYQGEVPSGHPPFSVGSKARLGITVAEAEKLEYSDEDEMILEKWLRENVGTTWHSLGTCKMMEVVDEKLGVYGVEGLKIVDLSVVRGNVGANTCGTAMVVGEKGAEIIRGELGL
ncbi:putative GMC oxidoreductase [Podospora fimiseda]|uniref:GMC oxidoreductase n=1 Tax=Podospora fimiseda TaxID=252190 RepID=A0AAN7BPQ1_9PEZI|nr:putative GMC oxidoreductase [Podospora fimiseda]